MDRADMLAALEDYWLNVAAQNPEEGEMMDIPAAMEYYRSLPLLALCDEYDAKFLEQS